MRRVAVQPQFRPSVFLSVHFERRGGRHGLLDIVRARRHDVVAFGDELFERAASTDWQFAEEAQRRLYEAIANLHPTAAQILMLRYVHDYSVAEIATLLGTTRSTVAVSLFRSRLRLRKLINALGEKS